MKLITIFFCLLHLFLATSRVTSSNPVYITHDLPNLLSAQLLHWVHIKRRHSHVTGEETRTTGRVHPVESTGCSGDHCAADETTPGHVHTLPYSAPVKAGVPPAVDGVGGVRVEGYTRADGGFTAPGWRLGICTRRGVVVGGVEDL